MVLAALRCDVPARRATLAGERGIDPFHPAGGLVLQAAYQQAPTRGEHAPVQPGFLAHVPARLGDGALSRARHVPDAQVLDADHVEPAREISGGLLGPVLSRIGLASCQPSGGQLDPDAAVRPTPGPGQPALKTAEPALPRRAEPGNAQNLASRQRRARGHATINSDDLAGTRRRDGGWDPSEGDMPAACAVKRDPVGSRACGYGTRPAKPHPADLRDPGLARVAAEPTHMLRLNRDNTEPLIAPGFPPSRPAVRAREEIRHRLGEVPQRLLLNHLAAGTQPLILGTSLGELAALLQIARRSAAPWMPPGLLLDREVPHESGVRAMVAQRCFLSGSRYQAVAEHSNIISTVDDIPGEVKQRVPHAKRRVSTPRSMKTELEGHEAWTRERGTSDDRGGRRKVPLRRAGDEA